MRNLRALIYTGLLLAGISSFAFAPAGSDRVRVTVDNFIRAESDMYFSGCVNEGGFGKLAHHRQVMSIDGQTVIRANRDTLYSTGVFDLDAGPVAITLPDPDARFMSLIAIDEDHYVHGVVYGAGRYTFARDQIGTRYVMLGVRALVNPADPRDLQQVHRLQDEIVISQSNPGRFDVPNWDPVGQKKIRDALLVLGESLPDTKRTFGSRGEVDPVRHLIGTAMGWGGNPEKDALYFPVTPDDNDGETIYQLRVKDVPVDGFWSVSVYNAGGYFQPNTYNAYTLNNITATKEADGSVVIQFGGCDGETINCLPVMPQWNYTVRLYRPRPEVRSGAWIFPAAEPVR
jgi:hypothetical protein